MSICLERRPFCLEELTNRCIFLHRWYINKLLLASLYYILNISTCLQPRCNHPGLSRSPSPLAWTSAVASCLVSSSQNMFLNKSWISVLSCAEPLLAYQTLHKLAFASLSSVVLSCLYLCPRAFSWFWNVPVSLPGGVTQSVPSSRRLCPSQLVWLLFLCL